MGQIPALIIHPGLPEIILKILMVFFIFRKPQSYSVVGKMLNFI